MWRKAEEEDTLRLSWATASPGQAGSPQGLFQVSSAPGTPTAFFHTEQDEAVGVDKSCWNVLSTPHFMQFSQQNLEMSLKSGSDGYHLSICPTWMEQQLKWESAVICWGFLRSPVPQIWVDCPWGTWIWGKMACLGISWECPNSEGETDSKMFEQLSPTTGKKKGHCLLLPQARLRLTVLLLCCQETNLHGHCCPTSPFSSPWFVILGLSCLPVQLYCAFWSREIATNVYLLVLSSGKASASVGSAELYAPTTTHVDPAPKGYSNLGPSWETSSGNSKPCTRPQLQPLAASGTCLHPLLRAAWLPPAGGGLETPLAFTAACICQ